MLEGGASHNSGGGDTTVRAGRVEGKIHLYNALLFVRLLAAGSPV